MVSRDATECHNLLSWKRGGPALFSTLHTSITYLSCLCHYLELLLTEFNSLKPVKSILTGLPLQVFWESTANCYSKELVVWVSNIFFQQKHFPAEITRMHFKFTGSTNTEKKDKGCSQNQQDEFENVADLKLLELLSLVLL